MLIFAISGFSSLPTYAEESKFEADTEYINAKVVGDGETVNTPSSVKGYKNINWTLTRYGYDGLETSDFDLSKPITILSDVTFYGYGEKGETPIPEPDPTPEPPTMR